MRVSLTKSSTIIRWLLFAATILFIITGLGITEYQIIEKITFGLLSKALSQKIHHSILYPFLLLFISHIILAIMIRRKFSKKQN